VSRKASSRWALVSALGPSGLDDSPHRVRPPDPATGRVPAASVIPDCVPLNLFGGAGSITEEQLAYVMPRARINRGTNEQRYGELVLSGPGGQMLGRDLQWVLGADYRREAAASAGSQYAWFKFSATPGSGVTTRVNCSPQRRCLAARSALGRDMALNIGVRWSDFFLRQSHDLAGRFAAAGRGTDAAASYGEVLAPASQSLRATVTMSSLPSIHAE
jgi:hypothetical protein